MEARRDVHTFDLDDYVYGALRAGASGFLVKDTELVAAGLSNNDIAERLVLSPATAKTHVSRIMTKLQVHDRAQLVVLAYEAAMITPGWYA